MNSSCQSFLRVAGNPRPWQFALGVLGLVFLLLLVTYHLRLIRMPIPLDYYEGTMPAMTSVLAEGRELYTYEVQPEYAYVYTPLYNYIAVPVSRLLGNTLFTHRLISAFFIYSSVLLVFLATFRAARSSVAGLAAAGIALAAFLFYSTPVASTNGIGLFFFLATVVIPWLCRFSPASLVVSAICGTLAFFSKQYFVVGLAFVSIALFLSYSIRKSIIYAGGAFVLLMAALVSYSLKHPYFLDNTVFSVATSTDMASAEGFIAKQLMTFGKLYGALIAMVVAVFFLERRGQQGWRLRWPEIQFKRLQLPLLNAGIPYFLLCFLLATLVIVVSLGKNQGNYMTYLFQLMSPCFVIACLGYLYRKDQYRWLLVPSVAVVFIQVYLFLPRNFDYTPKPWETLDNLVASHDNMLLSPILIAQATEAGKPIRSAGHTFYFRLAENKPALFLRDNPEQRVQSIWARYVKRLYQDIEAQKFDLIVVNQWDIMGMFGPNPPPDSELSGRDFLRKYYKVQDRVEISMTDRPGGGTYTMQVYVPKTAKGRG